MEAIYLNDEKIIEQNEEVINWSYYWSFDQYLFGGIFPRDIISFFSLFLL